MDRLNLLAERAYQCKYLNAVIPSSVYYICALAVEEPLRGKGIGKQLVDHAIERSKGAGMRGLHLDVLSDADAVGFYGYLGCTVSPRSSRRFRTSTACRWKCGWR